MEVKIGDMVVGSTNALSHRIGKDGIVTGKTDAGYWIKWGNEERSRWAAYNEVRLGPIGKTLTELDVKPGDVVEYVPLGGRTTILRCENGRYYGSGCNPSLPYCEDADFRIISRAPQPTAEPAKPKRMHPDDVADAIAQYALDCGFMVEIQLSNGYGKYTYNF